MVININGSDIEVSKVRYDKSNLNSKEVYNDCHVTFLNGEETRYDACDIVILQA